MWQAYGEVFLLGKIEQRIFEAPIGGVLGSESCSAGTLEIEQSTLNALRVVAWTRPVFGVVIEVDVQA
jgi:hypothetical protein